MSYFLNPCTERLQIVATVFPRAFSWIHRNIKVPFEDNLRNGGKNFANEKYIINYSEFDNDEIENALLNILEEDINSSDYTTIITESLF